MCYNNKQSCGFWDKENLRVIYEKSLLPQRVTVFGVHYEQLLWLVFQNSVGGAVNRNGIRSGQLITHCLGINWMKIEHIVCQMALYLI